MIKQGARVNYSCPELSKPSPLDLAILKGDVSMLQMLLAAGKTLICVKVAHDGEQEWLIMAVIDYSGPRWTTVVDDGTLSPIMTHCGP